jgi:hypothetical protein
MGVEGQAIYRRMSGRAEPVGQSTEVLLWGIRLLGRTDLAVRLVEERELDA